jgi:ADP-ribose pyrophosphatase YjhB (NUDIX family)
MRPQRRPPLTCASTANPDPPISSGVRCLIPHRTYHRRVPIPDFVLALREKVGTALLWLPSTTAVVLRGSDVLLVRRADNGAWTPVTGIVDPGEQPAVAAVREVAEEADVQAVPESLVMVLVTEPVTYANGDRSQYLDLVFRMRWQSGEPSPVDGENTDATWFPLDALPPLSLDMRNRIQAAVDNPAQPRFTSGSRTGRRHRGDRDRSRNGLSEPGRRAPGPGR